MWIVLQRNELKVHEKENCPLRIVECKHCRKDFRSCELPNHIDECPKMNILCTLCGIVMYREDITTHVEENCPEEETECLFAKYMCEVIIKRKHLDQHLEEKRTEHLELKLNAMENFMFSQSRNIKVLNETIAQHSRAMEKSCQRIANLEEKVLNRGSIFTSRNISEQSQGTEKSPRGIANPGGIFSNSSSIFTSRNISEPVMSQGTEKSPQGIANPGGIFSNSSSIFTSRNISEPVMSQGTEKSPQGIVNSRGMFSNGSSIFTSRNISEQSQGTAKSPQGFGIFVRESKQTTTNREKVEDDERSQCKQS